MSVRPRYQLDGPPPARQTDLKAWGRSVGNAQAQLEHQDNRLVNLELLQRHGANTWRAHLQALEAIATRYAAEKDELRNRRHQKREMLALERLAEPGRLHLDQNQSPVTAPVFPSDLSSADNIWVVDPEKVDVFLDEKTKRGGARPFGESLRKDRRVFVPDPGVAWRKLGSFSEGVSRA